MGENLENKVDMRILDQFLERKMAKFTCSRTENVNYATFGEGGLYFVRPFWGSGFG